jgi:hypothetical protein
MPNEQAAAAMSRQRGQMAAKITDPDERQNFIAQQGRLEGFYNPHNPSMREGYSSGVAKALGSPKSAGNPLGSFKQGGTVPKTGVYKLHKDEKVIPAKSTGMKDMMSMAGNALAHKKDGKKKVHLHIKPSDNDGYSIEQTEHMDGTPGMPTHHVYPDTEGVMEHVGRTYGHQPKSKTAQHSEDSPDWEQGRSDKEAKPKGKKVEADGAKEKKAEMDEEKKEKE